MNINEEIEKYVIHLKFQDKNGSGVVIKPFKQSDYCYIFTAKHTFEEEDEYSYKNFFSPIDYNDEFEIITSPYSKFTINSIIELENKNIDLLIICIKNSDYSFWENIPSIKIFGDELRQNIDYVIAGFPRIRNHNTLEFYDMSFQQYHKNSISEFKSKKPLTTFHSDEMNTNSGISGGGVFLQGDNNELYLVGIEFAYQPSSSFNCISLGKLIDNINSKLHDKIGVGGFVLLDKYALVDKEFDLSILESDLESKYIQQVKDKPIEFIINEFQKENIELKEQYMNLKQKMNQIANAYLYKGAVLNNTTNYRLATLNFNKAIQLNPNLEKYLEMAKYIRNSENYKRIDDEIKRKNQVEIDILKGKIEEETSNEVLRKLYVNLLFCLEKYKDFYKEDILKYKRILIDEIYIRQGYFKEAESILENPDFNEIFDRDYIRNRLFKIYVDEKYLISTKVSKKEFADKLFTLLGMFDFESDEYLKIRTKIEDLNVFDNFIISLNENLIKSERKFNVYEKKIGRLTEQVNFLSKHVSEEKLLHEVNFKIFNSHKKLDKIKKLQDDSINITLKGLKTTFLKNNKNNHENIIISFLIFFILGILALNNQVIIELLNPYYDIFLDFIKD